MTWHCILLEYLCCAIDILKLDHQHDSGFCTATSSKFVWMEAVSACLEIGSDLCLAM